MKLSIIYHIYSDVKTLEKSLKSLFNQTNKNFELILIDDYATNEAKEILEKFDISDKKITLIRLFENYGRSFCYNLGLEKAKGDYVYFAESKNIFEADFVETISSKINAKNKYDYISFKIPSIANNSPFKEDMEVNETNLKVWVANCSLTIRNKIIRKKFLEDNKIAFVNYKNLYPIYLFEVTSSSKKSYYIHKDLLKLENKNYKSELFSYNLYDILESAFLLSYKINDSKIDDEMKDCYTLWLSKLCLRDFLSKMFQSYENEKVLTIAITKAWETIEKIDINFKTNKNLDLIARTEVSDYIKKFKPTYNYVRKYIICCGN